MESRVKLLYILFALFMIIWLFLPARTHSSNGAIAGSSEGIGKPVENVSVNVDGAPAMGNENAPLAIVEFGDYQCPYCNLHANQTLPQIVVNYVKAGKVRYFFKDFPVEGVHPQAFQAAAAARCAGEQDNYWAMHDRLLQDQQTLVAKQLSAYALALGLDITKFQQCIDNGTYDFQIRKDVQEGREKHVQGTPEFFVGTLDGQSARIKVITVLHGYMAYSAFQQALDPILASQ
jgi:protein-disulfide isomerase